MEAPSDVTESGFCAEVVNKLCSAISVTDPPCYSDGFHKKVETINGDQIVSYGNDCDSNSESDWTGQPEENVSNCQDNAHCECQKQVNKTLHIEDGGNKSWRLFNLFNVWREKSRNATAKTGTRGDVSDFKCVSSSKKVLEVT
jgi:hypothetical protein